MLREQNLSKLGFRFGLNGPHAARTMMLDDLRLLLAHTPASASRAEYADAIIGANVLGKATKKARELALRHLSVLYGLNASNPIFRALRRLWPLDASAQPVLALAASLARDPLLRASEPFVLGMSSGTPVPREDVEAFLATAFPDRFSAASLKSFAQNVAGTWTAAGYLHGHRRKTRAQAQARPEAAALCLFLGFLEGRTGQRLFSSNWMRLLGGSPDELEALTRSAAHRGLLVFMRAGDRLLKLLITAWETVQPGSWKPAVLNKLLADADCVGKGLEVWLRDKFFEQHAKRFHHRPFIWHVWDGLKDGFAALVNYHKLDAKNLERLIHTYLGRWISDQEDGVRNGVDGAPTRLAAAQDLKRRLELILEGEKPYDIFVRWKSLAEQPIGWNPDLNDGVRLNIRPFMTAEVLRHNKKPKLNITWDKDRGKDVESAPWFKTFKGERINDHHLTLAEKMAARSKG